MSRRWYQVGRNLSLLVAGLTLGLLISLSWRAPVPNYAAEAGRPPEKVWAGMERLEAEQRELRAILTDLRQELNARQKAASADTDRLQALKSELERQRLLAGLVSVQGPGVTVTLDDSQAQIPLGADANTYIIHEHDLRDIVNLLWMAGSEAVAINDERLVANSSIYCVGSVVMVNDTRLSPPYVIRAIGNPRVQQEYLRNPSYLNTLKEKARLYGLEFEVMAVPEMILPEYDGSFLVQHARLGE